MDQYAMYLRKSRLDDPKDSIEETLSRHEKILFETARKMNLCVVKKYPEVVSGESITERPQMQALLNDVDNGLYAGVLVVEIERLARGNSIDQGIIAQSFQLTNTKIVTPNKVIDPNNEFDSETLEFGLFMSRREYKTINRRLQRGKITSVKEGKWVGNDKTPYGYVRHKLEKQKGYTLATVPDQAEVVKMIFDLYVHQRIGVGLIVRRLNDLRIPPAKGDVWVNSSIQSLLRNPVYAGKIRWNSRPHRKKMVNGQLKKERPRAKMEEWILVDGLHAAIIDQETFDLAQKYLAENPSRPCPKERPIQNPLAGLIVCGVCGRRMVRRPYQKKELPATIMCPATACPNISTHLYLVEEKLLQSIEEWLKNYKLEWSAKNSEDHHENNLTELKTKAVKKIEDELADLEKQMGSLHDLLERGIYDADTFFERSRILSERRAAAREDHATLIAELQREEINQENQKNIIPRFERALESYRATDEPERKNEILHQIIEKAVYIKNTKSHWRRIENRFELILYPITPHISAANHD